MTIPTTQIHFPNASASSSTEFSHPEYEGTARSFEASENVPLRGVNTQRTVI